MRTPFISVQELSFSYPGGRQLFECAELTLAAGEKLGIWAENGSGKTTFLRIITGLARPQKMKLELEGRKILSEADFKALRRRVGFVLQNPESQLFFPEVLDDVMFGPLNIGLSPEESYRKSLDVLEMLGIADLRHSESFRLSGGQKRLVSLASVLAMEPYAVLLDEPTTGLDKGARGRLLEALEKTCPSRIVVSHDIDFLNRTTERMVTIRGCRFAEL